MKIEVVQDLDEKRRKDNQYVKRIMEGKADVDESRAEKIVVVTPKIFSKLFSAERVRLMLKLRDNEENIYQLANELGRKYEAVYRDIKLLEGFQLIKTRKEDRSRIPFLEEKQRITV